VTILLTGGIWGFLYARNIMLRQWTEHVMLQLEQAAQKIESGLSRPMELMKIFGQSGADGASADLPQALVDKLKTLPGVVAVNVNWHTIPGESQMGTRHNGMGRGRFMRFHRGAFARILPPVVDETIGKQTVSIKMVLMDADDTPVGNFEIVLLFEALVAHITANPWWQNATACIADRETGKMVLTSGRMRDRNRLGETGDRLEQSVKSALGEKSAGTVWGQGQPPERIAGYHNLETFPWAFVVFADGKTILAPIIRFRNGFIIGAAALILTILIIIRFNVDRISSTVKRLSQRAGSIASGDYKEKIEVHARDEIGLLANSFNTMIDGLRERDAIRNTFGMYVDPDLARTLLSQPQANRLGGRRRDVAVLMADIRGFTPMTEKMPPEETVDILNRYFSAIIPLIQHHRGIIVDFIGDGILAFFEPFEETLDTAARRCLQCAFAMQDAMGRLNEELTQRGLPDLAMGVGINVGPVVVGNIGSKKRKKYGIVGSAVNITQRIQGQSHADEVVISEAVYRLIRSDVAVSRTISTALKGVASEMKLYAVYPNKESNQK